MNPDSESMDLTAGASAAGALPSLATEGQSYPGPQDTQADAATPGQQAVGQQAVGEAEVGEAEADLAAEPAAAGPPDHSAALLLTICENVERLAVSAERYHARAEQREGVIDHLHDEVDRLRRGERRGLLRPLLVEMCRLRNDLLRQAEDLPGDFDAGRARLLLRSYAESVELALEDGGVTTFAPETGDRFEPRMHRRVGGESTDDPESVGRVAQVRRSGYLDVDTNIPIAPAEVMLYVPAAPGTSQDAPREHAPREHAPREHGPREHGPESATGERKEL
jgi:molecular chaperone GrpE